MKKVLLVFLVSVQIMVHGQQWRWARKAKTTDFQAYRDICADNNGNVFVLGANSGTADFKNSAATILGPGYFIAKFDSTGVYQWGRNLDGFPNKIGTDSVGNFYISGTFTSNLATSTGTFTNKGGRDIFLMKYDPAGSEIWTRAFGGKGAEEAEAIVVDGPGNVYMTGSFRDTLNFGAFQLTEPYYFVTKINNAGSVQWAKAKPYSTSRAICLDKNLNVYTIGTFRKPCDYCIQTFLDKYDQNGNVLYEKEMDANNPLSIQVDKDLNIYFYYNVSFNTATNNYMTKYDASFNEIWHLQIGGGYASCHTYYGKSELDDQGNIYFHGKWALGYGPCYTGTVYGQPVTKKGEHDLLITKLTSTGGSDWTFNEGSKGDLSYALMSADLHGNCYVVGNYNMAGYYHGTVSDTVIFNKDTLINDGAWSQLFIAKLGTTNTSFAGIGSNNKPTENMFQVYPNPNSGSFSIVRNENSKNYRICIYDVNGTCILSRQANEMITNIDLGKTAKGMYFIELSAENTSFRKKLIVE